MDLANVLEKTKEEELQATFKRQGKKIVELKRKDYVKPEGTQLSFFFFLKQLYYAELNK